MRETALTLIASLALAGCSAPRDIEVAAKKKNKFHVIPPDEVAKIRKAAEPVFAQWFATVKKVGIDGPALLKDARAMIDKYSK